MGDMHQPPPNHKPKVEMRAPKSAQNQDYGLTDDEVKRMEKDPVMKKLLEPLHQKPSEQNPDVLIINRGRVNMTVPKSWKVGTERNNAIGSDSYIDYLINGDKDATLSFYYRGRRTSESDGERFHKILQQAPHELSDSEYSQLRTTLRRIDESFTKKSARTEKLNGKTVLILEGSYDKGKSNQEDIRSIYIDSDKTGTAVQEVYFQAAQNKYREHLKEVDAAFKSISWN